MFILKNINIMVDLDKYVPKNDKGSMELLIRAMINDILNGATSSVMVAKAMEGLYEGVHKKVSDRRAYSALREARLRIKKDTDEMIPSLRDDMINRALDVYTECRESGDRLSALKALDQINKVCGLYEQKLKVDANVNQNIVIDFGIDNDDVANESEVQD